MNSKDRIVVIGTHPDDETYGAGGSLLRFKAEGAKIFWLIITNVHTEHGWSKKIVDNRQKDIQKSAKFFGYDKVINLDYPTTKLDELPKGEIIGAISKAFNEIKPTHVILPFYGDPHSDHRITFECAYACTKVFRYSFIKNLWMMEVPSETDFSLPGEPFNFNPTVFVDITAFLDKKIKALSIFESELGKHPFPRSEENVKAIATIRGAQAGVVYAEAFVNIKSII